MTGRRGSSSRCLRATCIFRSRAFRGGLFSHSSKRSAEQRDRVKTVPAVKLWASCCSTLAMHWTRRHRRHGNSDRPPGYRVLRITRVGESPENSVSNFTFGHRLRRDLSEGEFTQNNVTCENDETDFLSLKKETKEMQSLVIANISN